MRFKKWKGETLLNFTSFLDRRQLLKHVHLDPVCRLRQKWEDFRETEIFLLEGFVGRRPEQREQILTHVAEQK